VDAFGADSANPVSHRVMGKLVAEFVGPDCLALYHPPNERIVPVTSGLADLLQAKLRGDCPIEALFGADARVFDPVVTVAGNDPRMLAAMDEARRRFPEFLRFFRESGGQGRFAVKARLESGDNAEHLWVEVYRVDGGRIWGSLCNDPVHLENYRAGTRIDLSESEIEDWGVFAEDGGLVSGLFTTAAIEEIEAERNQAGDSVDRGNN
jgi:uncharacterized protein YegJ (DUF2314 family)